MRPSWSPSSRPAPLVIVGKVGNGPLTCRNAVDFRWLAVASVDCPADFCGLEEKVGPGRCWNAGPRPRPITTGMENDHDHRLCSCDPAPAQVRALSDDDLLDIGFLVLDEARRRGVTVNDCPAWCQTPSHPDLFSDEAYEVRLAGDDATNVLLVQDQRTGQRELFITPWERAGTVTVVASGAPLLDLLAMLTAALERLEQIDKIVSLDEAVQ